MSKLLSVGTENALEAAVLEWVNGRAEEYGDGARGVLKDLAYGGCASGMVSHLVYTADAAAFYRQHQRLIDGMAYEAFADAGCGPDKLFSLWDAADPFAREDENQCVLAWFGFEEAARTLADRAGFEV